MVDLPMGCVTLPGDTARYYEFPVDLCEITLGEIVEPLVTRSIASKWAGSRGAVAVIPVSGDDPIGELRIGAMELESHRERVLQHIACLLRDKGHVADPGVPVEAEVVVEVRVRVKAWPAVAGVTVAR